MKYVLIWDQIQYCVLLGDDAVFNRFLYLMGTTEFDTVWKKLQMTFLKLKLQIMRYPFIGEYIHHKSQITNHKILDVIKKPSEDRWLFCDLWFVICVGWQGRPQKSQSHCLRLNTFPTKTGCKMQYVTCVLWFEFFYICSTYLSI